jgi:PhnB protein
MQTLAHLHYKGNCREAFNYYARTLGGKVVFAMTYGESPIAAHSPQEVHDQIIHARLDLGSDGTLLGCDTPSERYQAPQGFNVAVSFDDPNDAERAFNALADGGNIVMPFAETFWSRRFGMCTDRFGIPWMVNCQKPEAAVNGGA